jgi:hypothetical protein
MTVEYSNSSDNVYLNTHKKLTETDNQLIGYSHIHKDHFSFSDYFLRFYFLKFYV